MAIPGEIEIKFTKKQGKAFLALEEKDTVFFGGGAGSGKSWLICATRLQRALSYPGYKSFIGREELKRLMGSTYLTFIKVCTLYGVPRNMWKLNGQYNYIEFTNGSRIDLLDLKFLPSDPLYERFGSLEYTDGCIEEAGEVDFRAYDVLKSRIGRHMNDELGLRPTLLITGNPKKNWTYREFYLPWKKGTLHEDKAFITSKYMDNPYTAISYGKSLSQISDTVTRSRLMDGNWEYDDDATALLNYDEIITMFDNDGAKKGSRFMTIDPAFGGKDMATVFDWDGWRVTSIESIPKVDHDNFVQIIEMHSRNKKVPKRNIIADIVGEGAYLAKYIRGIRGFIGSASPLKDPRMIYEDIKRPPFANLRSQCIWEMAQLIKQGKVSVDNCAPDIQEKIIEELQQWRLDSVDDDVKIKIVSKDVIRENIGRSTDYSDALYERVYFELMADQPVVTDDSDFEISRWIQEREDWDPYSIGSINV